MERGFAIPDDGPELGDEAPSRAEAAADRRLADTIYERILGRIASGEFAVGAKLPTEHELSGVFGVSRPVLRQALKQLRTDGAIVSRQGSGSYVRRRPEDAVLTFAPIGSIADIQRTFEFRAAIEGEAAYLAAERRSAAMLQRIRQTLNELARCVRDGELGVEADEAFHALICDASNNHYFVSARNSMNTNILTGLRLTRSLSLKKSRERLELFQSKHDVIYDAIARQNREGARLAMRQHIENARQRVFEGEAGGI